MIERFYMAFPHESELTHIAIRDDAGLMLGTVTFKCTGKQAEFNRLYIIPEARRQGVGRDLIRTVVDAARLAGCESVSCIVHPENSDALKFYRALGFFHATTFDEGHFLMAIQL